MKSPEKIDPRWNWHHRTLLALRAKLVRERNEHFSDAAAPVDPEDDDPADLANERAEREVIVAALKAEDDELAAIDAALQRLRDHTYGICVATGEPIAEERLRAIPWTPYSRAAADRAEQALQKNKI